MRCRSHYRVEFYGQYEHLDCDKEVIVDVQDTDEVYYLFNVYLADPDVRIFLCYNDGTEFEIMLQPMAMRCKNAKDR